MKMGYWESSNVVTFMRGKEKLGEHNKTRIGTPVLNIGVIQGMCDI
jgi:hypothetical protein